MRRKLSSLKDYIKAKYFRSLNATGIVYKFRDWQNTNHRNILYHNEIYLASPADFNDPFDCRIIPDFSILDTRKRKKEWYLTNPLANRAFDTDKVLDNIEKIIKNPEEYAKNNFEFDDKHMAIFCVSTRWDIIPLWSHYANFHKGFCVGFHLEKLSEAFSFSKIAELHYGEYPTINPTDQNNFDKYIKTSFKQTHYKSKDWEHEKEFRLTRTHNVEMTLQDRLVYFSNDCIAEITLGLKFPTFDIPKVRELATIKKWPLYQAKRIPMKFGLDREVIN